jgi:hypothetical protein
MQYALMTSSLAYSSPLFSHSMVSIYIHCIAGSGPCQHWPAMLHLANYDIQ